MCSSRGYPVSAYKSGRGHSLRTIGKDDACKCLLFDSQMISEQALENGPQVGGRFEIAPFMKLGRF